MTAAAAARLPPLACHRPPNLVGIMGRSEARCNRKAYSCGCHCGHQWLSHVAEHQYDTFTAMWGCGGDQYPLGVVTMNGISGDGGVTLRRDDYQHPSSLAVTARCGGYRQLTSPAAQQQTRQQRPSVVLISCARDRTAMPYPGVAQAATASASHP